MTKLSPAAQSVLDALCVDELNGSQQLVARAYAAAALRATADQVVPMALCVHNDDFVYVRHQLQALADELEAQ